jgi:hypothetical protein
MNNLWSVVCRVSDRRRVAKCCDRAVLPVGLDRDRTGTGASPRHVPAKIIQIADIPRTKSGKITELAVRDVVHGRAVKNTEALANPEALKLYEGLAELRS